MTRPLQDPALPSRRTFLGGVAGAALAPAALAARQEEGRVPAPSAPRAKRPVLVGSRNALAGMKEAWPRLQDGGDPLDAALAVVAVTEADPEDHSVGLGGLPNEDGVVQLDAACMDGRTHNSGAVAALENVLHPSQVARLVMERTDHCLLVGEGAYRFARAHGHPHVELLTDEARRIWLEWKESMSGVDDRLPPPAEAAGDGEEHGSVPLRRGVERPHHGTIHCSALSTRGEVACTTSTSGLPYKIPGRVGDSPIVGAGLYCDAEAGSAGATGRGEAAILANGSFAVVERLRQGDGPREAALAVLERVVRQTERQARWQPALLGADGRPAFDLQFYVVALDGTWAGVALRGRDRRFAVADEDGGPRLEPFVSLLD